MCASLGIWCWFIKLSFHDFFCLSSSMWVFAEHSRWLVKGVAVISPVSWGVLRLQTRIVNTWNTHLQKIVFEVDAVKQLPTEHTFWCCFFFYWEYMLILTLFPVFPGAKYFESWLEVWGPSLVVQWWWQNSKNHMVIHHEKHLFLHLLTHLFFMTACMR